MVRTILWIEIVGRDILIRSAISFSLLLETSLSNPVSTIRGFGLGCGTELEGSDSGCELEGTAEGTAEGEAEDEAGGKAEDEAGDMASLGLGVF